MPLFECSIFTTLDFSPGCVNASFLPMFPPSRAIKRFAQSRVLVDRPDPGVSIQERRRASPASLDRPASAAGFRGSPGLGAGRFRFTLTSAAYRCAAAAVTKIADMDRRGAIRQLRGVVNRRITPSTDLVIALSSERRYNQAVLISNLVSL